MSGRLTTHVLDTAHGCPAAGLTVELWRLAGDTRHLIMRGQTNADGRLDQPLLTDDTPVVGVYELVFAVGAYFAERGVAATDPPFLDQVPVRFGLSAAGHYHVPLLVSPWAYSTYRGS
ncbi:MAG: hydroxyisourate hydrolase [Chloroflexota bacterium]|nr:hydroxyisourate hydrolase [Chloroflexota bacterium]